MVVGVVVGIIVVYEISGIFVVKVVLNINVRGVGGGHGSKLCRKSIVLSMTQHNNTHVGSSK